MPVPGTDDSTRKPCSAISGSYPEYDIVFVLAEALDCRLEGSEIREPVFWGVAFGVVMATVAWVTGRCVAPAVKRECEGEED